MYSYGPFQRFIDGRQARWAARTSSCTDLNDTPLVQRLRWTYRESSERVFARVQAANFARIEQLRVNSLLLMGLDEQVDRCTDALGQPSQVRTDQQRGGEEHLEARAVAARRSREAEAARSWLKGELDAARAKRDAVLQACHRDAGLLEEQFELLKSADVKLRFYALRRAANYGRAWDALREDVAGEVVIDDPSWAGGPCPWLPKAYTARCPATGEASR